MSIDSITPLDAQDNCPLMSAPEILNARQSPGDEDAQIGDPLVGERTGALRLEVGFDSIAKKRRVLDWLGAGLRPDRPGRLQQEFPLLFQRNASVFHLTLFQGSVPVSFCCLWAVRFRIGVEQMRVGLISLVYTDPQARGCGYAQQVVEAAMTRARSLDLGLALLWSEADSLYSNLGFAPAGAETLLVIDRSNLDAAIADLASKPEATDESSTQSADILPATFEDWAAIERLRGDRDCQLELDLGEITRMRSIPDMSVRVARDATGVVAFAIRGRGDDFQEVIHEWGGRPEAVLRCCRDLLDACEPHNELFLLTPPDQGEVPWRLRRAGARVIRKPLGWMRIVSASAFENDLSRLIPGANESQAPRILDDALASLSLPFFVWGMESI